MLFNNYGKRISTVLIKESFRQCIQPPDDSLYLFFQCKSYQNLQEMHMQSLQNRPDHLLVLKNNNRIIFQTIIIMHKDQQILANIKNILSQEQKLYSQPSTESKGGETNLASAFGLVNALGLRQFILDTIVFKPRTQKYTINKIGDKNELISSQMYQPPRGFTTEIQILQYKNKSVPVCRLIPSEPANNHVIIYAHGNASDLFDSVGMMENIAAKLNMELVVFDYTGYGCSRAEGEEKTEISEKSIRGDLEVVLGWVTKNKKLSEIILWGFSLGTYPVCCCASKYEIPAIILQSPFASLARMFQNTEVTLQTKIKDDYLANINYIHKINSNILLLHSSADTVIPISHSVSLLNKYLTNRYNRKIEFVQVDRVDHNQMHLYFSTEKKNQLQDQLFGFIKKVCSEDQSQYFSLNESVSSLSFSEMEAAQKTKTKNFERSGKLKLVTPLVQPTNNSQAWLHYVSSNTKLSQISKASEDIQYLQTENGQVKIRYAEKNKSCLCGSNMC